jgi:hypothetical protein
MIKSEVVGVFRVDICIDGPGVMTFLQRVHAREIMLVRQSSYHSAKKIVGLATDEIEGFGCGSRKSGRYFRCYNKTKEINDNRQSKGPDYKRHITDFHEWNGMRHGETLGRLEVELHGRFLKTVEGFKWEDVLCRSKMIGLFQTAMGGVFEWVPTLHSDSKINRRPRVEIVDFSGVKETGYQRSYPVPCKTDRMEKMEVKKLIVDAAFVEDEAAVKSRFSVALDTVERHNLHGWLKDKKDSIFQAVADDMMSLNEEPHESWQRHFDEAMDYVSAFVDADRIAREMTKINALKIALNVPLDLEV